MTEKYVHIYENTEHPNTVGFSADATSEERAAFEAFTISQGYEIETVEWRPETATEYVERAAKLGSTSLAYYDITPPIQPADRERFAAWNGSESPITDSTMAQFEKELVG